VIIVVGGNARHVGKTTLICAILHAFPGIPWQVLKVTPHEHLPENGGDTTRFLSAGATTAVLRSPNHLPALDTGHWIVESNRILDVVKADAYIFLRAEAPPDEKPQARWHLDKADVILQNWAPTPQLPDAVRQLISSLLR
jgi:hypothetical protein